MQDFSTKSGGKYADKTCAVVSSSVTLAVCRKEIKKTVTIFCAFGTFGFPLRISIFFHFCIEYTMKEVL